MTPLTGNRELAIASWRLVEAMGAPGARSYVADRIRKAEAARAAHEVIVWRLVAEAVRRLAATARQRGVTLH